MNSLNGINDSMKKICLCNEKIQKENMSIKSNVNRISTVLEEMKVDKDNIQKYTDKIEKAIGNIKIETTSNEHTEKNVKKKNNIFMIISILFTVIAYMASTIAIYNKSLEDKGDILVSAINIALLCNTVDKPWVKIIFMTVFVFILGAKIIIGADCIKIILNVISTISIIITLWRMPNETSMSR